jgi:hypothetical protein
LGNDAKIYNNKLNYAINGCGFRYCGSNLSFHDNTLEYNFTTGISLWINDHNNYLNNEINHNSIFVKHNSYTIDGVTYNSYSRAIFISRYDSNCGIFKNTRINNDNMIYGIMDVNYPRGIYLQACSGVTIDHTTFNNICGYQIEINSDNVSGLISDNNTFESSVTVRFCDPDNDYMSFAQWQTSGYDLHSINNSPPPQ